MQQKTLEFDITPDCAGARLDRCLSRLIPGSSRAYLQKLIKDGLVRNGSGESITLPRYPVKAKEHIVVLMPEMEDTAVKAEDFDYPILFEDEHMLVIAKPAGVVVHPAAGNPDGTIVNVNGSVNSGVVNGFTASTVTIGDDTFHITADTKIATIDVNLTLKNQTIEDALEKTVDFVVDGDNVTLILIK